MRISVPSTHRSTSSTRWLGAHQMVPCVQVLPSFSFFFAIHAVLCSGQNECRTNAVKYGCFGVIHRGASWPGLVIAVKKTVCASAPSWSERDFKGDVDKLPEIDEWMTCIKLSRATLSKCLVSTNKSWTCTLMRRALWRQSDIWRQVWSRFQTEWIDWIAKTGQEDLMIKIETTLARCRAEFWPSF